MRPIPFIDLSRSTFTKSYHKLYRQGLDALSILILSEVLNQRSQGRECILAQDTLGEMLSASRRTIQRSISKLRKEGWLLVERQPSYNRSNIMKEGEKLIALFSDPVGEKPIPPAAPSIKETSTEMRSKFTPEEHDAYRKASLEMAIQEEQEAMVIESPKRPIADPVRPKAEAPPAPMPASTPAPIDKVKQTGTEDEWGRRKIEEFKANGVPEVAWPLMMRFFKGYWSEEVKLKRPILNDVPDFVPTDLLKRLKYFPTKGRTAWTEHDSVEVFGWYGLPATEGRAYHGSFKSSPDPLRSAMCDAYGRRSGFMMSLHNSKVRPEFAALSQMSEMVVPPSMEDVIDLCRGCDLSEERARSIHREMTENGWTTDGYPLNYIDAIANIRSKAARIMNATRPIGVYACRPEIVYVD